MEAATEENEGGVSAGQANACPQKDESQENIKLSPCPHRYAGCISQNGYMCTLGATCRPMDAAGRRFAVTYSVENGQTYMTRTYYRPGPIIDAETLQAEASIRASVAAIESTPFGSMSGDLEAS